MKNLITATFLFLSVIILAAAALFVSPYYFYNKVLEGSFYSEWYSLSNYKTQHLLPRKEMKVSSSELGNGDLWRKFHLIDVLIPLPVKNPFYYVTPVLKYVKEEKKTEVGLKIYDAKEREISKIYFMQNRLFSSELSGQKFFQLPLVKKHLLSFSQKKIWKDMFSLKLNNWSIPFKDMAYNLYLLHLRTKLLPKKYIGFSLVKGSNTAVIELESTNKDYITELILTKNSGIIYSFILLSERDNQESQLIRYKLLNETQFQGGSIHLAKIIYREFKGLEYNQQIDHEGMLYLLSAWSHDTRNKDFIKEMIFYLERADRNQRQLESLYKYAFSRFGETFTNQQVDGLKIDDNLSLQRNVELEKKREEQRLSNQQIIVEEKKKSKDEEIQQMLKAAKRKKKTKKKRIIID